MDIVGTCIVILGSALLGSLEGTQLTVTPETIAIGDGSTSGSLRLRCDPPGTIKESLFQIEIGKVPNAVIARTTISREQPTIVDPSYTNRWAKPPMGSVAGTTGFLELDIREPGCADVGSYYCTVQSTDGSDRVIKNVTSASSIKMALNPKQAVYYVGDRVELTCQGVVGNQFNPDKLDLLWSWQWRAPGGLNDWTNYPDSTRILHNEHKVVGSSGPGQACQYNVSSMLYRYIKTDDNARQFRCSIGNPGETATTTISVGRRTVPSSGKPPEETDTPDASVPTHEDASSYEPPVPTHEESRGTQGANVGAIIGGVVAAVVVIAIVVGLLLFFLVFRKKKQSVSKKAPETSYSEVAQAEKEH